MSAETILAVDDLQTHFFSRDGVLKAVDGVSFSLDRGRILGMVGESGSGKTVTGYSLIGLIDEPGRIVGGSVKFRGEELVGLTHAELRHYRGSRIAMIFQDPMMTLNPVLTVGDQMIEAILAHENVPRDQAMARARDALGVVGIPSPEERLAAYPFEFSGGMRQRVAIATAFLNTPDLIIADEPTTALDVTIQGQILAETQRLCRERGVAMIWITHDLSVVAGLADDLCVMYCGRIVERGTVDEVIDDPRHPYTQGLIASVPSRNRRRQPLAQIPGMVPSLLELPPGCAFSNRCARADARCAARPSDTLVGTRAWRCFNPIGVKERMSA
jgi:peptide/nickel transport system ATP-binding protein